MTANPAPTPDSREDEKLQSILTAVYYAGVQSTVHGATIKTPTMSVDKAKAQIQHRLRLEQLRGAIEANKQWLAHVKRVHKLVNISQLEKEIAQLDAELQAEGKS